MANDRNAGKPPKYKKGTVLKKLQNLIPKEKEREIVNSINEICKDYLFIK